MAGAAGLLLRHETFFFVLNKRRQTIEIQFSFLNVHLSDSKGKKTYEMRNYGRNMHTHTKQEGGKKIGIRGV